MDKTLAFQIRSLRGDLSQQQMEEKVGIRQQVMSRLEKPTYGKATLTTLKRIAAAFDVGLLVEFVPFSQLINRTSGTPYTERGLSPDTMNIPSFDEENQGGLFASKEAPVIPPKPQSEAMPLPSGQTERPQEQSFGLGSSRVKTSLDESGGGHNILPSLPMAGQQSSGVNNA